MAVSEVIIYRGIKFRRYPESSNQSHRRYFGPGIGDKQRGIDYLHREIWRDNNDRKEIPDGYHIHHINHDYNDNRPENLQLVKGSEHVSYHMRERLNDPEYLANHVELLASIRPLTKEWHASEEGRKWHKEHFENSLAKAFIERTEECEQCGSEYTTTKSSNGDRFCSNNCKSKWRRESGIDNEQRNCAYCSASFTINKYSKTRCCTRSCSARLRWKDRTTSV